MPTAKYALKQPTDKRRFKENLRKLPATDWTEKGEQYCDYRLDGKSAGGWLRAKQFSNGTLYLEASNESLLLMMTNLLQDKTPVAKSPVGSATGGAPVNSAGVSSASHIPGLLNVTGTYIGTDESGKGDYFGPLVIAGVLVTEKTTALLQTLGVMDSKKLTDRNISELYQEIVQVVGESAISVIEMAPTKYNAMYSQFKSVGKNLNHLLAWGHAAAIENLLEVFPDCTQAIADQFGNERYITSQLQEKGQRITLHQTHRAEANTGVAAASIVARYRFVKKLKALSEQCQIALPLGAGPQVKVVAREYIRQNGLSALGEVAKLHFKTTAEL